MALSPAQETALRSLIAQEGARNVVNAVQSLASDKNRDDALGVLLSAISVTVPNWPTLKTTVANLTGKELNVAIASLITLVDVSIANSDGQGRLGAYLLAEHIAIKDHFA